MRRLTEIRSLKLLNHRELARKGKPPPEAEALHSQAQGVGIPTPATSSW